MFFQLLILSLIVRCGGAAWLSPALSLPATPELPAWDSSGHVRADDGSSVWYARFGNKSTHNDDVVTFLHGGLANSDYWAEQIRHVVSQDYTCLAIDSRGHGRSVEASNSTITYSKMTRDVIHVLDRLQISRTAIVGWSDGAIIGLDMAMHYSSRLTGVFAFGATYSPANMNSTITSNPIFAAYLTRTEAEFVALNPRPEHLPVFESKVNDMWSALPDWTEHSFLDIVPVSEGGPLIWIVDGADEEAVNRIVPSQLFEWVRPLSP